MIIYRGKYGYTVHVKALRTAKNCKTFDKFKRI